MQKLPVVSDKKKSRIKNTVIHNGKRQVCRIFDAGPNSADRYTAAFKGWRLAGYGLVYPYISASSNPFHPQGIGQHGESKEFMTGKHLGRRIQLEDCPNEVREFICQNLT